MVEDKQCNFRRDGCFITDSLSALGVPAAIIQAIKDAPEDRGLATTLNEWGFEPLRAVKMAEVIFTALSQHPELCIVCGRREDKTLTASIECQNELALQK